MKNKLITSILLLLINFSFCQKKYDDWESAKKESEISKKNILIILTGSDWCKPCVKMEKNVIDTKEFIEYANQNLIILEINLQRHFDYNSKLVKNYIYFRDKYQTNSLPSLILVNSDGKEITKISSGLSSLEKVMKELAKYK
jgi:thioredoxin-related protein